MKIALLGTRGIPNSYGGFEEFADFVSRIWVSSGHYVYVYCEKSNNQIELQINGLNQVFIETGKIPFFSQILYDYRCTKHALSMNMDIYYHAGYATSVLPNFFLSRKLKKRLVYNMDGLEWKRSKFNYVTRLFILSLEKLTVKTCTNLVADNKGIADYLQQKYKVDSHVIEYGINPDNNSRSVEFDGFDEFDLVIARFEPENHLEVIIRAYSQLNNSNLVLVANRETALYKKLESVLNDSPNILFFGPCYDRSTLNGLRSACRFYIHGHSVGGTNPSLVDALSNGCQILANDNIFNADVAGSFASYWKDESELVSLIKESFVIDSDKRLKQKEYAVNRFNWEKIAKAHLKLFDKINSDNSK